MFFHTNTNHSLGTLLISPCMGHIFIKKKNWVNNWLIFYHSSIIFTRNNQSNSLHDWANQFRTHSFSINSNDSSSQINVIYGVASRGSKVLWTGWVMSLRPRYDNFLVWDLRWWEGRHKEIKLDWKKSGFALMSKNNSYNHC